MVALEATRWNGGGGVEGVAHPKVYFDQRERERERREHCDMNDGWLFVFV